jgi:hypothetical protein
MGGDIAVRFQNFNQSTPILDAIWSSINYWASIDGLLYTLKPLGLLMATGAPKDD